MKKLFESGISASTGHSDDFEPNYSLKGNRGSVWTMTLTMQTRKSGNPTMSHIYPIAVGAKGEDHDGVVKITLDDIKALACKEGQPALEMCNAKTQCSEKVSAHLICMVQDQPERRGFNALATCGHPRSAAGAGD